MVKKIEMRVCKKCKKQFVYDSEKLLPRDIEYCSSCRGDEHEDMAVKMAKVLSGYLKK